MPVDGQTLKNGGIRAERGEYLKGRGKGGMGGGHKRRYWRGKSIKAAGKYLNFRRTIEGDGERELYVGRCQSKQWVMQ